ncbi:MAG TPA: cell wall-binding repeat-containing protein [Candidatus Methanoperedens sp.]|nr:cell wall-binding repeat-containing protein [Candidatus Methanoperedens sp.]
MLKLLLLLFLLAGLSILNASAAPDQVVINSANWQDVYLGAHYAGFNNIKSNFLVSSEHAYVLLQTLDTSKENILLVESDKAPFAFRYKTGLEGAGFIVDEIISSGTALNIELAKRANTSDFIIVDDSYGYNAISVAPYAAQEKFFVLFANKENIDELYSFLQANGVNRIIIYGFSDIEVKSKLAEFNPVIINNGSRFDNNIELLKRYKRVQQVFLTNGEFIEEGIMSGKEPVLFPGRERVPNQVVEYIKSSGIKTGVVIGNELTGVAHQIKQATDMNIFLKFGQGFASGGSSEVKALDMFPLPKYELAVDINSVKYNRATKELEVIYENKGNMGVYLSSSIEVLSSGVRIATLGDKGSVYMDIGSTLAVAYASELNGQNLTAKFTTMFGEDPGSFERALYKEMKIEMIEVIDSSSLNISKVSYDKAAHKIKVGIRNTGEVKTYAKTQIKFVIYGDERIMVQDKAMLLEPGASKDVVFITTLSDTNIEENPQVNVRINYGERETVLIKVLEGNYPLIITGDYTILIIVVILLIIGNTIRIQYRKKRIKDQKKSMEDSAAETEATEISKDT